MPWWRSIKISCSILGALALLLCLLLLFVIVSGESGPWQLDGSYVKSSYGPFQIGDTLEQTRSVIAARDLSVWDQLERIENQVVSTATEEPTVYTSDQLPDNQFLASNGWAYPTEPLLHRMIILIGVDDYGDFTYLYFDEDNKISAIYLGGS